jgi:hypothetical protein
VQENRWKNRACERFKFLIYKFEFGIGLIPPPQPIKSPPARIALIGFVALADVMACSRFLPCAIRSRLAELRLRYRSFC